MLTCDDVIELIKALTKEKTSEEQVKILKDCLTSILYHGWVDEELRDAMMANLAKDYKIPYQALEDEGEEDDE